MPKKKPLSKSEFVKIVTRSCHLKSNAASMQAVNAFITGMIKALEDGESVSISGFGVFSIKHRAERQGRNPRTGESVTIKAANKVVFQPGKHLKDAVNK